MNLSISRFLLKNNVGELKFAVVNALDKSMGYLEKQLHLLEAVGLSNYLQSQMKPGHPN